MVHSSTNLSFENWDFQVRSFVYVTSTNDTTNCNNLFHGSATHLQDNCEKCQNRSVRIKVVIYHFKTNIPTKKDELHGSGVIQ